MLELIARAIERKSNFEVWLMKRSKKGREKMRFLQGKKRKIKGEVKGKKLKKILIAPCSPPIF